MTSTRPYLLRAFYEWIVDNNLTPYIVINTEHANVYVPEAYIEDGRIVLNVSPYATESLKISNQSVEFDASFSGVVEHISAPIPSVIAVYARENGRGMVFSDDDADEDDNGGDDTPPSDTPTGSDSSGGKASKKGSKPNLRVVK